MPPKGNTARRGGGAPRPHKRPQPGMGGGYDDQSQEEDDGQFDDQTDAEKRQVRDCIREIVLTNCLIHTGEEDAAGHVREAASQQGQVHCRDRE